MTDPTDEIDALLGEIEAREAVAHTDCGLAYGSSRDVPRLVKALRYATRALHEYQDHQERIAALLCGMP